LQNNSGTKEAIGMILTFLNSASKELSDYVYILGLNGFHQYLVFIGTVGVLMGFQ